MKTEKNVLITGSTGGIGREISRILAEKGWNLIFLNRSQDKAVKQVDELKKSFPEQTFDSYLADMMDLSSVAMATEEISSRHPEICALYNVAGVLTDQRRMSAQGVESHFAVNVLAPYLITQRLRAQLSAGAKKSIAGKSVVINFSSSAIKGVKELEVSKLVDPDEIGGLMGAYAKSKMAITIVNELLREDFRHDGILLYSVDPGPTKTPMTGSGDGMPFILRLLQPLLFKSPEIQAAKLVSGVESALKENANGVFISEGKQKKLPSLVSSKDIQGQLNALLDSRTKEFSK